MSGKFEKLKYKYGANCGERGKLKVSKFVYLLNIELWPQTQIWIPFLKG